MVYLTNCREGDNFTKERLDRAVANRGWCERHQFAEVWVLTARSSDHKPICLRWGEGEEGSTVYSKKSILKAKH